MNNLTVGDVLVNVATVCHFDGKDVVLPIHFAKEGVSPPLRVPFPLVAAVRVGRQQCKRAAICTIPLVVAGASPRAAVAETVQIAIFIDTAFKWRLPLVLLLLLLLRRRRPWWRRCLPDGLRLQVRVSCRSASASASASIVIHTRQFISEHTRVLHISMS